MYRLNQPLQYTGCVPDHAPAWMTQLIRYWRPAEPGQHEVLTVDGPRILPESVIAPVECDHGHTGSQTFACSSTAIVKLGETALCQVHFDREVRLACLAAAGGPDA